MPDTVQTRSQLVTALASTGAKTITAQTVRNWLISAPLFTDLTATNVGLTATCATTAALASNTYANGSSGVGATLTATGTGTLTIDGHLTALGDMVLVKNESSQSHNGLYLVTTAGAAGVSYVLTRAATMNTPAGFAAALVAVALGTTNGNTLWQSNPNGAVTVGTTSVPFVGPNLTVTYLLANPLTLGGSLTLPSGQYVFFGSSLSSIYGDSGGNLTLSSGGSGTISINGVTYTPAGLQVGPMNVTNLDTTNCIICTNISAGTNEMFFQVTSTVGSPANTARFGGYNGSSYITLSLNDQVLILADGVLKPVQAATASAPAYVKGGLYFDTTLNKLRVGGASAWETVTSA